MLTLETASSGRAVEPLEKVTVSADAAGTLVVLDGQGREYLRRRAGRRVAFAAAGALGRHEVRLEDAEGRLIERTEFHVDCQTAIEDAGGRFRRLLEMLYWTMRRGGIDCCPYQGKVYEYFVCWLRDHVHTLKGMKYFYPNLKSAIELYRDSQRDDGMIWDNVYRRSPEANWFDHIFSYGDFIRPFSNGTHEFKRIPVENDVEYLYVEGLYYTWKATGDDAWMASMLDSAVRAFRYSTTSPYRWSETFGLLKRGYTIDTWDFQTAEDAARTGHAMVITLDKTRFGVMFGDNTGFAVGCDYLAEMLDYAGRSEQAEEFATLGAEIRQRLDEIAWNGQFFTHHVPEDPSVQRDLGVDESRQVSLSNAYSINRGVREEQAQAIIRTYQRIRRQMPAGSPGEFYQIYPPFERGFGGHNAKWEYMNGGVTTIVAGELAHGAFEHGFEDYGVDILRRVAGWGEAHNGYFDCCLRGAPAEAPKRTFQTLDLRGSANVDFVGGPDREVTGWLGVADNDLAGMPTGKRRFCEVPFDVIDPARNGRRACIGLADKPGYALQAALEVGAKARSLYFLHTASGSGPVGTITLEYADGTRTTRHVVVGRNVGHWWMPQSPDNGRHGIPHCQVAWRGPNATFPNVGVYAYGLDNPQPDKRIERIVLEGARDSGHWFVLGVTRSDAEVFFPPSDVSFGIPDNWGAAAVAYALIEGLAGVKDAGVAFDRAELSPRWSAAEVRNAGVTIKYPASDGYVRYRYAQNARTGALTLEFTGTADRTDVAILLPAGARKPKALRVDGQDTPVRTRKAGKSLYALAEVVGVGRHEVVVTL